MAAQTQSKNELPADRPYKRHLDEAASHQTEDFREPGIVEKAVETSKSPTLNSYIYFTILSANGGYCDGR